MCSRHYFSEQWPPGLDAFFHLLETFEEVLSCRTITLVAYNWVLARYWLNFLLLRHDVLVDFYF